MSLEDPNLIDIRAAWNQYCTWDMTPEESNEKFEVWFRETKERILDRVVESLVKESVRIHTEEDIHRKQKLGFDTCIDFINSNRYTI